MKEIKIYKCDICGNIVLKLVDLTEKLVCCGEPMILIKANSTDGANEKHVPFIKETIKPCKELNGDITEIQVGSTVHPMLPEHHIAWIGTFSDKSWDIKWLNPTDKPNVITLVEPNATVYEYCNLHGLWKK